MLEKWNETQEIKKQGGILGIAGVGAKAEEFRWLIFTLSNSVYSLFYSTPIFLFNKKALMHAPIYLLG